MRAHLHSGRDPRSIGCRRQTRPEAGRVRSRLAAGQLTKERLQRGFKHMGNVRTTYILVARHRHYDSFCENERDEANENQPVAIPDSVTLDEQDDMRSHDSEDRKGRNESHELLAGLGFPGSEVCPELYRLSDLRNERKFRCLTSTTACTTPVYRMKM